MKNHLIVLSLFSMISAAQAANQAEIPSLATVQVSAHIAPGQSSLVRLYHCGVVRDGIPNQGSCQLSRTGLANVPFQYVAPGQYFVEVSGSLYPGLVNIPAGKTTELKASSLQLPNDPEIFSYEVFYDLNYAKMQDLVLKFIWGTAPCNEEIQQICSELSQKASARAACQAWASSDYRALRNAVVRFVADGSYEEARLHERWQSVSYRSSGWSTGWSQGGAQEWSWSWPILMAQFSSPTRWSQARSESGDSVALFPGFYDIARQLPDGAEQIIQHQEVQ